MTLIQSNVKGCNSNCSLIHFLCLVPIFKRNEEVVIFQIPYQCQIQWLVSIRFWVKETSTPWMRYSRRLLLFWDNNRPMIHSLSGIKGKENMFAYKNDKGILEKGIFTFYLCSSPTPLLCFHWLCLVIFRVIYVKALSIFGPFGVIFISGMYGFLIHSTLYPFTCMLP